MDGQALLTLYVEANRAICRTHGLILEAIKIDLDKRERVDVTPVQALVLCNIGGRVFKADKIEWHLRYLAPNIVQLVEELFEKGFLDNRAGYEFRMTALRLSAKGKEVCDIVEALYQKHAKAIGQYKLSNEELTKFSQTLFRLEALLNDQVLYKL